MERQEGCCDTLHTKQSDHRPSSAQKAKGWHKSMSCPEAVYKYNRYMGRVDKGDQLRKYYHVRLKCQKNYKYIFWFAFDTAITNAFILSQYSVTTVSQTHLLLKNFRLRLAERLIGTYCSQKRAGQPHSSSVPSHPPPCLPTHGSFGPTFAIPPDRVEEAVCLLQQVPHPLSAENDSVVLRCL